STQIESPEPEVRKYQRSTGCSRMYSANRQPLDYPLIKLLPGAQLPKGRIYPLSIPEHQVMEYIAEAQQQGFIQPSTSPAASSFFFVGKKPSPARPAGPSETPRASSLLKVGEIMITAPLISLLKGKPKHLAWNPTAHEAFQWLKTIFCTAPLLRHPDLDLPFTIEVDASTTGVRAVLSQGYLKRSSRTGVLNSSPTYGKPPSSSVNLSSGYHPQTNGQTERKIQELGRYLRSYCQDDQHSWSRFLLWAKYAQNSLRQDTTGLTPFQCVLGFQPPLFPWTEEPSNAPAVDHWFRVRECGTQHTITSNEPSVAIRGLPTPEGGRPPNTTWGPSLAVHLQPAPSATLPYRIHPTFHVLLLKPFSPSATDATRAEVEPPPPKVLDQPSIYSVNEILDSRRRGGRLEYLVD
ncbi:hypothetical protein M9458_054118, partial [Cirrhinus mrigala]